MKIIKFNKVMWSLLTASLIAVSPLTHAEWIGKGKEVDYLGRELSVPPKIGLLENTHPVSHDFTGKALYFKFDVFDPKGQHVNVVRFDSDESMTWWNTATPEKKYTASYVVFEIAKNIYYLNWAENTAYGLSYEGVWPAAIVVDLDKMVATDTFVSPALEGPNKGKPRYQITQLRIAFEDIAAAKGDLRYVPATLAKK